LNTGIDRDLFPESTEIKLVRENDEGLCSYWISEEDQIKMFTENIISEFQASLRSGKKGYFSLDIRHTESPDDPTKRYRNSIWIEN
jgi:hypothetical protein